MNASKKENNKVTMNGKEKILNIFMGVIPIRMNGEKLIQIIKKNGGQKTRKLNQKNWNNMREIQD